MKITDVSLFKIYGYPRDSGYPFWGPSSGWLDLYPEFNRPHPPEPRAAPDEPTLHSQIFVEIHTGEGVAGLYGPIHERHAFIIERTLRPFLIGRDPLATELLSDQMQRAWIAFAKSGNPGWPAYDTTTRPTMMFDVQSRVVNDPFGAERQIWEDKP